MIKQNNYDVEAVNAILNEEDTSSESEDMNDENLESLKNYHNILQQETQQIDGFNFYKDSEEEEEDFDQEFQFFNEQRLNQLLTQQKQQKESEQLSELNIDQSDITFTPKTHNIKSNSNNQTISSIRQVNKNDDLDSNVKDKQVVDDIIQELEKEEQLEIQQKQHQTEQEYLQQQYLWTTEVQDYISDSSNDSDLNISDIDHSNSKNKTQYQKLKKSGKQKNIDHQAYQKLINQKIYYQQHDINFIQKNNKSSYSNPLDLIAVDEQNMLYKQNFKLINEQFEKELILSKIQPQNHKNMVYSPLEQISFTVFQDSYGIPKSILGIPEKFVIVGTSKSIILVFDYFNPRNMQILGEIGNQHDIKTQGPVTCLDLSYDKSTLVAGYQSGDIIFWNLENFSQMKKVNGINESTVLSLKFRKKQNDEVISCDAKGNVFLFTIKKVFWSYSLDQQRLLPKTYPYFEIITFPIKYAHTDSSYNISHFEIVALCSQEQILILSLYPKVRLLHKISKPVQIRLGFIPQISFQPLSKSQPHILKYVVAWGSLVRYYKFHENLTKFLNNQVLMDKDQMVQCISHIVADHSCLKMNFLSEQMLVYLNTRNQLKIYNIQEFVKGDHKFNEKDDIILQRDDKNYKKCIKNQHKLASNIDFQSYIFDREYNSRATYNNTISINPKFHDVYLLCEKQIYRGHLNLWSETLDSYLKSYKWNDALKLCSELYHQKINLFANQPDLNTQKGVQNFEGLIKDMLVLFLEGNQKKLNEFQQDGQELDFMWKQLCTISIEFCIDIENFQLLFKEVRGFFFINEQNTTFLSCLEYFIINGQIKSVPDLQFREIIQFYKKQNKISVLQQFIIGLNIDSIEMGFAIPLCLEYQLYTPLTYICAKKNNDFITPLNKMYQEQQIQKEDEENIEKGQMLLQKSMWFIRNTFNGQIFPNEVIEDERRRVVIRQILVWLLVPEIFREYAESDSATFFLLIYELYRNPFIKAYLRSFDSHISQYFFEEKEKQHKEYFYMGLYHETIISQTFDIMKDYINQNEVITINLAILVAKICSDKDNETLNLNICTQAIEILLSYKDFDKLTLEQRELLILNILKLKESDFLENKETVENLIQLCLETENELQNQQFDQVMAYMSYLEESYLSAFNLYLLLGQKKNRVLEIFEWLQHCFETNIKFVTDFSPQIIENIKELIMLNSSLTKNFVLKFMYKDLENMLEVLTEYPPLLLDFMEKLLQEREKYTYNKDFYLTYITLLCKLAPQNIIAELKEHEKCYNFEQVEELCKINNCLEGQAYIKENQVKLQEAFEIYTQIFNEYSQKCVKKANKNKQFNHTQILKKFEDIINICTKIFNNSQENCNNIWIQLADYILSPEKRGAFWNDIHEYDNLLKVKKQQQNLQKVYMEVLAEFFIKILQFTSIQEIIDILNNFQDTLQLKYVKYSFSRLFKDYIQEYKIHKEAGAMIQSDLVDIRAQFIQTSSQGAYYQNICNKSYMKIEPDTDILGNSSKIMAFNCGHIYYKKFLKGQEQTKCPQCIEQNQCLIDKQIEKYEKNQKRLKSKFEPYNSKDEITRDNSLSKNTNKILSSSAMDEVETSSVDNSQLNESIHKPAPAENVSKIRANLKEKMLRKLQAFDLITDEFSNQIQFQNSLINTTQLPEISNFDF